MSSLVLLLLPPEPLVLLAPSSELVKLPKVPFRRRLVRAVPGTCTFGQNEIFALGEKSRLFLFSYIQYLYME
jgi:hypothetical protein